MSAYELDDSIVSTFELELLRGFARVAVEETSLGLAYREGDAVYEDTEVGIYTDTYPEHPADTVALHDYTVSDDPSLSDSVMGVQVQIRAATSARLREISSALFDLFQGRQAGMLGTIRLVMSARTSGTNVGQDSGGRLGRIENYYLTVHRPSPHRS